jgi:hypothetical protein
MPRDKSNTKSGWKARDRKYQEGQREKARANRVRNLMRFLAFPYGQP